MKKKLPKLRNLKPRNPDAAVVAQIRMLRPNLSASCPTRFFFYFTTEEMTTNAANELRLKGFEVDVVPPIGTLKWLCLVTKKMFAETAALVELREEFVKLARKYKGEYDGWETEISDESISAG